MVSFKVAAKMLVAQVKKVLRKFPTSIQEDELEMARMKACAGQDNASGRSDCVGDESEWTDGKLMAIQFRIERKKMLHKVVSHLARDCMNEHELKKTHKQNDAQDGPSTDGEL